MTPEQMKQLREIAEQWRAETGCTMEGQGLFMMGRTGCATDLEALLATFTEQQEAAGFQQGYVCAISCIVSGHGSSTMVEEALAELGPIDWKVIDEHDRRVLSKAGLKVTK